MFKKTITKIKGGRHFLNAYHFFLLLFQIKVLEATREIIHEAILLDEMKAYFFKIRKKYENKIAITPSSSHFKPKTNFFNRWFWSISYDFFACRSVSNF